MIAGAARSSGRKRHVIPPHVIPGRRPVAEALRAGRAVHEVVLDRSGGAPLDRLGAAADEAGVPVRRCERGELDQLAGGVVHQGAVALAPPFPYGSVAEVGECEVVVMLDGITDPHNLGAIARTAEAAGAGALIVRERRGAGVTPAAEKAAAGALSWLRVVLVPNLVSALGFLTDRGFWSVGLSENAGEDLWTSRLLDGKVALVVGAEGAGLSRLVTERVDGLVQIPMAGRIASLNASVAAAVVLYEIARRRTGE